jgi:hypothetical protein
MGGTFRGSNMIYFKTAENGKPTSVCRIDVNDKKQEVITERYDKFKDEWIDYPEIERAVTGLDDKGEYVEIEEEEAMSIINPTSQREALGKFVSEKLKKV